MRHGRLAAVAVAWAAAAAAAGAAPITIDPDDFPDGTVMNDAYTGVTLSANGNYILNDQVLAMTDPDGLATTGTRVFGRTSTTIYPEEKVQWGDGFGNWLRADFDDGAVSVSIDFIADDVADTGARLRGFDSADQLVDDVSSTGSYSTGQHVTLTVESSKAAIAYVLVEPDLGGGSAWRLDHMVYEPVPEPAVLTLVLVGAAGLVRRRRR